MEVLGHVPHLLGHGVAVNHKHNGTGGAAELIDNLRTFNYQYNPYGMNGNNYLSSNSIAAWNIDKLHSCLVLDGEREPVVVHGGVGLPSLPRHKLTKDSGLTTVTDSSDEDIYK